MPITSQTPYPSPVAQASLAIWLLIISIGFTQTGDCYATEIHTANRNKPSLGHLTLIDPNYGLRNIIYAKLDGYAVVENDILLTKIPKASPQDPYLGRPAPQAMILLKLGGFRWPDGIVPFSFAPSLPPENQLAILDAMLTWEKVTKIRFVELSQNNANKYSDYLLFTPTDNLKCSSFVGRQGGPQIIILGPNCAAMNVAHELGHALGLWHEQSRNDRDQYIKILWENIDEDYRYNFTQHISDGEDVGNYEYQSIMHYTAYAFSKNGQPTIIPREEGVLIGQRKQLSTKDIAAVNAMYP